MRLIPRNMETHPRTTTSSLALIVCVLIGLAHAHEHGWTSAANFLLGFATALLIVDIVKSKKQS